MEDLEEDGKIETDDREINCENGMWMKLAQNCLFLICILFNNVSSSDCIASNDRMINTELERIWKEAVMVNLRYYPNTFLEG
jgi:hypothetical protein